MLFVLVSLVFSMFKCVTCDLDPEGHASEGGLSVPNLEIKAPTPDKSSSQAGSARQRSSAGKRGLWGMVPWCNGYAWCATHYTRCRVLCCCVLGLTIWAFRSMSMIFRFVKRTIQKYFSIISYEGAIIMMKNVLWVNSYDIKVLWLVVVVIYQ